MGLIGPLMCIPAPATARLLRTHVAEAYPRATAHIHRRWSTPARRHHTKGKELGLGMKGLHVEDEAKVYG